MKELEGRGNRLDGVEESRALLEALFAHSADATVLHGADGVLHWIGPSLPRVLGWEVAQQIGRRLAELAHPEDLLALQADQRSVLENPGTTVVSRIRMRHQDGSWRWIECTAQNFLAEPGLRAVVINLRDVTQRKSIEEHAMRSRTMDAIGRLAGGIAHDFNNMLSAIRGFAGLAHGQLSEADPIREDIAEVITAAERATSLTRQLLAFSRKQVMQPRVIDVNARLREMEPMLLRILEEDIDLELHLAKDACIVKADPVQLEKVIFDLAVHGRDSMQDGGQMRITTARVRIDGELAEVPAGEYVRISVIDSGIGMDGAFQEQLFEPFFTTRETGSGLGLATIFGIVKQSGGHIRVESQLGSGSTFEVLIPSSREAPDAPPPEPTLIRRSCAGETILLAENEPSVRHFVRRALTTEGYEVLEAASGSGALIIAEQHRGPIHLLLTDVVMPRMSGPQLAQELTSIRPELRVLYMSGCAEDVMIHDGVLTPGTDLIEKPVTAESLTRMVRTILDRPPAETPDSDLEDLHRP